MPSNGQMPNRAVLDYVAKRSLRWRDTDKFTLLWGNEAVMVKVDTDRDFFLVLTRHTEENLHLIYDWLQDNRQFVWDEVYAEQDRD